MTVPPPFDPTTPAYGIPVAAEPYPSYPPPPPGPYPYPPYPYPPPPQQRTNGLAIAALVCAFLFAPLGIVFGHLSLSQIKRSGEEGRGLAIAGLVIGYVITVGTIIVLVLGMLLFSWAAKVVRENPEFRGAAGPSLSGSTPLPRFEPPVGLGSTCAYPATATPAAKPVKPPRPGPVSTDPGVVDAELVTNDGAVALRLDNAKAPCTVNSFVSLAQQGYFDNTECHRLTDAPASAVLQCGDPTGTGAGGPGYRFANEYPTNQYRPFDRRLQQPVIYPRGTLAMANSGPDTNGSQFFIVYRDSKLPPTYTVFGTVDETGLTTVERLASVGVSGGENDGKPNFPITIESLRLM